MKMASYQLLIISIIIIVIVTISLGYPTKTMGNDAEDLSNYTDNEKKKMLFENKKNSKNFKCVPQRRSFLASDLFERGKEASIHIYPAYYVLHRCDSQSGCCPDQLQTCEKLESENVTLVFNFTNKISNSWEYEARVVSNHTKCTCVNKLYTNSVNS